MKMRNNTPGRTLSNALGVEGVAQIPNHINPDQAQVSLELTQGGFSANSSDVRDRTVSLIDSGDAASFGIVGSGAGFMFDNERSDCRVMALSAIVNFAIIGGATDQMSLELQLAAKQAGDLSPSIALPVALWPWAPVVALNPGGGHRWALHGNNVHGGSVAGKIGPLACSWDGWVPSNMTLILTIDLWNAAWAPVNWPEATVACSAAVASVPAGIYVPR